MSCYVFERKAACMLSCVCAYLVANASVAGSQSCWFVCLSYLCTVPKDGCKTETMYVLSVDDIKILLVHSTSQDLAWTITESVFQCTLF